MKGGCKANSLGIQYLLLVVLAFAVVNGGTAILFDLYAWDSHPIAGTDPALISLLGSTRILIKPVFFLAAVLVIWRLGDLPSRIPLVALGAGFLAAAVAMLASLGVLNVAAAVGPTELQRTAQLLLSARSEGWSKNLARGLVELSMTVFNYFLLFLAAFVPALLKKHHEESGGRRRAGHAPSSFQPFRFYKKSCQHS